MKQNPLNVDMMIDVASRKAGFYTTSFDWWKLVSTYGSDLIATGGMGYDTCGLGFVYARVDERVVHKGKGFKFAMVYLPLWQASHMFCQSLLSDIARIAAEKYDPQVNAIAVVEGRPSHRYLAALLDSPNVKPREIAQAKGMAAVVVGDGGDVTIL
jgi:hypothetical protein